MAETVGSLADKLTIVALKIYHMKEQAERREAPTEFREQCRQRVVVLEQQRDDLAGELTTLVADVAAGRVVPRVYRQFKMYNDPNYRADLGAPAARREGA